MKLKNKVALITGASRGIGRAIAEIFAGNGATIALHYNKNIGKARQLQESLPCSNHTIHRADISDPVQCQMLLEATLNTYRQIDILVNSAGIYERHDFIEIEFEAWQENWQRTIATNLFGAANLCFLTAKAMVKTGGGRIINISSRGAFRGESHAPAYGASKAGLNSFSQSMAKALAKHDIFVYVIAPGPTETDMARLVLDGPDGEKVRNESPLGRVAKPEEIANTALFLASEGAEFLTGDIIDVNGASYLRS